MKTMRKFGMMLMTVMIAFSMTACGDDDDNGDSPFGGGSSVTVNGTTFSVYKGHWDVAVANGSDTFYTLQFYNFSSVNALPDPIHIVSVVYHVTNGDQSAPATGEFSGSDFNVSVTKLSSNESQDRTYYTYPADNASAKLKVTKSGSNYTVEFGAMKYTDGSTSTTYNGTAFSFSGALTKGLLIDVD